MDQIIDALKEHDLTQERVLCVWWSMREGGSGLYAYAPGREPARLSGFLPLPKQGALVWDAIEVLDESASRLLPRFYERFPECYEVLQSLDVGELATDAPLWMLACAGAIMGLSDEEVVEALKMERGSLQVEMKNRLDGGIARLDTLRALRSLISYKVAGVANAQLAFSLFESLADYLLATLNDAAHHFPVLRVLTVGDLIAGNIILRRRLSHRGGSYQWFGLDAPKEDHSI
ncbi:MAG: hypothetical protein K6347_03455 [Campylobacterales bacterium]